MITTNEILTDVYQSLVASPINDLGGGIYKGMRPTDSQEEDTVITVLNGVRAKFLQDGKLSIKIFYSDIFDNGTHWEDFARGETLEGLLYQFSEVLLKMNKYSFEIQSREIYTQNILDSNNVKKGNAEHYAILRINFVATMHNLTYESFTADSTEITADGTNWDASGQIIYDN